MKLANLVLVGLCVSALQISCAGSSTSGSGTEQNNGSNNATENPTTGTPNAPDSGTPSTGTPGTPGTPVSENPTPTPEVPVTENPAPAPTPNELFTEFQTWKNHYKKYEPFSKVTDNRGNGYEDLYGTRNFRVVLHGVYYRGGANNKYHRTNPRSNMNPLPNDGLKNLCEEGFSTAIYYYSENYSKAPKQVVCGTGEDKNTLSYKQKNALTVANQPAILQLIHDRIKGKLSGPIYGHCWNGWHASGVIAAISLRQFCGWTSSEARAYWRKNTDGNLDGYSKVEAMVVNFKPIEALKISAAEQAAICPEKQ